jgi:hypothetical protein
MYAAIAAFDEPLGPVDDGLAHAAASRARLAVAVMAAAGRAVRGHARRMTRMLSFIIPSSGTG